MTILYLAPPIILKLKIIFYSNIQTKSQMSHLTYITEQKRKLRIKYSTLDLTKQYVIEKCTKTYNT